MLYIATFFPNLTPYEFNRVVPLLLHGVSGSANNGVAEESEAAAQREKAALLVWRDSPDRILKECSLVAIPLRGSIKGVSFSNHSIRESLRGYLERDYNFFLENRFQDVQELGLLFSPSAKISQGAIQLSVEMAAAYPEYYGSK